MRQPKGGMEATVVVETQRVLDRLEATLSQRGGLLIIPHDSPDPDALASAAALHLLLKKRWNRKSRIIFSGIVSRAENREFLRHLKYHWRFMPPSVVGKRRHPAMFVDTAPWVGNVTVPAFIKPIAVFDHHPSPRKVPDEPLFADICPDFGAITTRFAECLEVAEIVPPKWLASLMAYAISTETADFIRHASVRDVAAYSTLLNRCSLKILGQIKNAALPRAYYAYLAEAVAGAQTYGRVSWTHLNNVEQPEIVAELADLLVRMERITWAFCTAFHRERLLISLRSELPDPRCGLLLHRLIPPGKGSAGGHGQCAAGYMDIAGVSDEDRVKMKDELVARVVAAIAGRPAEAPRPLVDRE